METRDACMPCFVRQGAEAAAAYAPGDPALQERVKGIVARVISAADRSRTPPDVAAEYFREIVKVTGVADPHAAAKRRSNEEVLELLPRLRRRIEESADPLETAVRMAIAGNIIDFGTPHGQKDNGLLDVIEHALASEICLEAFSVFRHRLEEAALILYLADNCGEAVMDRLLIEQLPAEKVVYAVRGKPILNDITPAELPQTGIGRLCRVMDNGADAPGTIPELCSPEFREVFERADMIIAKGQGNYETLNDCGREVFFLLKVKCEVVAAATERPLGSIVFSRTAAK